MDPLSADYIDRDPAEGLETIFWEADSETLQFTSVSPEAETLFGYPHSAWTSSPTFWNDIIHPDDRQRARDTRVQAIKRCEDHRSDYRVITADGHTRWIRDTVRLTGEHGQPARVYGVMIDVTESQEQRQREVYYRTVVENQRAFSSTFDEAPIGMMHISLEGRWLRVNRRLTELLGYAQEELIATSFVAVTHPDDVDENTLAFTQLRAGVVTKYECEKRYRHKDGHFVSAKLTAVLHRDSAGVPKYFISTIEDVTDRVRQEGQLRQGQKMEAIGRLAGGIAHDLNNLLTVIIGFSDLVLQHLTPGTPLHGDVEEIRHAGTSAAALTRQLLAFSRKQILQPQVLDLNGIVLRMNALLRRLIGDDVELATRLTTPLDRVWADPGQIEQIILNLALNARDAMPYGGSLTIETANADLDAPWVAQHPGASKGRHVALVISDTGIGMDETVQSHLFEPFFTTKERGKGTGLGLATVYGIVKQSGGSILVFSEPEHGTTFRVFLPRTEQSADPPNASRAAPQSPGGTETILLVEDQHEVRGVIRNTLTRRGYTVLEAANGAEALSIIEGHDGKVHLLLTDMVMPGMTGRELAEQLVTGQPDLRVLYTSGYTDDTIVQHGVLEGGMAFLQKPFTPNVLLQKIRDLLDAR